MKINVNKFAFTATLLSVFVCTQCADDELGTINEQVDYTEIVPDDDNVKQGQLVQLYLSGFQLAKNTSYTGEFAGTKIELAVLNDTTLAFMVPVTVSGTKALIIKDLKVSITYKVEEVTLPGSVDDIVGTVNASFEGALSNLSGANSESAAMALEAFKAALAQATDAEKREFAIYYEANKSMFMDLLNTQDDGNAGGRIRSDNLIKFKLSVFAIGAGPSLFMPHRTWER